MTSIIKSSKGKGGEFEQSQGRHSRGQLGPGASPRLCPWKRAVVAPSTRLGGGSVHFSRSVMSHSLQTHGLQHARPSCPSPAPGVYLNSCPLSQWCHPTISSSVIPFSSRLQSFPALGSFQMSQLFASGGQSTGVSASTSGERGAAISEENGGQWGREFQRIYYSYAI